MLDESCPVESRPELRGDPYCFAKVKQDELLIEYGKNPGVPYVILRPGAVYGPGKKEITGRVGIDDVPMAFSDLTDPDAHAKILVIPQA